MTHLTWQKSSHCAQGDSCVHVAGGTETLHLTESGDPSDAILTTTPGSFAALLSVLKNNNEDHHRV